MLLEDVVREASIEGRTGYDCKLIQNFVTGIEEKSYLNFVCAAWLVMSSMNSILCYLRNIFYSDFEWAPSKCKWRDSFIGSKQDTI